MMKHFYLTKRRHMRMAMCCLLICNTGCRPSGRDLPDLKLSADVAENSYLKAILYSHNQDSIVKCANADYQEHKQYVFISATPTDVKFDQYLAAYAKEKYRLILVNCGCRDHAGAGYYNGQMATLLAKTKLKSFGSIYLEAKMRYNKTLPFGQNALSGDPALTE